MMKVGDKVKVIKNRNNSFYDIYIGQIGEIIDTVELSTGFHYVVGFGYSKVLLWQEDELKVINQQIKIKYFDPDMPKLEYIGGKSDWIDLRSAIDLEYKAGEFHLIPLGVAIELPSGYEAHIVPRSSTFKNYGIIQTNHMGVVDESYKGDNDQWFMPVYALRDGKINKYDRICQFRIMPKMGCVDFEEVKQLNNPDRQGHGSTGLK